MKTGTIILIIIGIFVFSLLFIPAGVKCKLYFWNKNACAEVQGASDMLQKMTGETIDPNAMPVTQFDEAASIFKKATS